VSKRFSADRNALDDVCIGAIGEIEICAAVDAVAHCLREMKVEEIAPAQLAAT
jgi:hypothetical protein